MLSSLISQFCFLVICHLVCAQDPSANNLQGTWQMNNFNNFLLDNYYHQRIENYRENF